MRIKVITLSLIVALASQLSSGCCYWRPCGGVCGSSGYLQPRPLIPPLLPIFNRPILNRPIITSPLLNSAVAPALNYNSFAGPQLAPGLNEPLDYGYAASPAPTPGCTNCGENGPPPLPGPSFGPGYPPNDYGYPGDYGLSTTGGPPHDPIGYPGGPEPMGYPGGPEPMGYPGGYDANYQSGMEPPMDGNRPLIASSPNVGGGYPPPTMYPSSPAPSSGGTFQGGPLPILPYPKSMPEDGNPMK